MSNSVAVNETVPYANTDEQNFLFAYRAFVVAAHKKNEVSSIISYGTQADNDILENMKIFNQAIVASSYDIIQTEVIELPAFYPIAASGAFYLDFDFEGNPIEHSDERMEFIFVSLFPEVNKTYFLLSYFRRDAALYGNLGQQLINRNNLKLDISILLAAHLENIYFNSVYYDMFIAKYELDLDEILTETQFNIGTIGDNNEIVSEVSFTPNDYLANPKVINFFGY